MEHSLRVVLARHGETEWSRSGRHTSTTDIPLTESGRDAARRLGPRLAEWTFVAVWSSPRRRASETCSLAGFGDRVEIVPALAEWSYGEYEGQTTPEIRAVKPGWSIWSDGCPGGESAALVAARADGVIARLRASKGDAVIFSHAHFLRVLAARWCELPPEAGSCLKLATGSISVLGWERETPVIESWNATERE